MKDTLRGVLRSSTDLRWLALSSPAGKLLIVQVSSSVRERRKMQLSLCIDYASCDGRCVFVFAMYFASTACHLDAALIVDSYVHLSAMVQVMHIGFIRYAGVSLQYMFWQMCPFLPAIPHCKSHD